MVEGCLDTFRHSGVMETVEQYCSDQMTQQQLASDNPRSTGSWSSGDSQLCVCGWGRELHQGLRI